MSNVLKQLSVAIGGLLFVVVLIVGFLLDIPLAVSVFRATVVMCVGSIVVALFFRFFAGVLYRFVAEQILQQRKAKKDKVAGAKEAELPGG
ncbi:MAG: hypothetical protein A2283_05440 [Lentisphaerae bacterium RIFOXYA12_FULL_48_11]|nr:MAG: hypothetical protein A2283_05440 [Lentisphaerae bacterium RIFOXYA12_FULL_48_11]